MSIEITITDIKYKDYCKSVSGYSSQWEDLYQEFCLFILENKKKINPINTDAYLRATIYKMWLSLSGYTTKHAKVEDRMKLGNYADRSVEVTDYYYNESPDEENDITPELDLLLRSDNSQKRKKAELFNEFISGKNRLEISKQTGINYRTVHDAVRETAETIKHNMTKNEIKSALLAQGISSNYSGKTKTFFTNKKPSPDLEKSIIAVGFKVNIK